MYFCAKNYVYPLLRRGLIEQQTNEQINFKLTFTVSLPVKYDPFCKGRVETGDK